MNRKFLALLCFLLPASLAHAIESFLVKDIRVEGLQRISPGTLFNYLPIKVGDTITEKQSQEAIRALFKTGFFKDVRLERDGNVLIVNVIERPAISSIKFSGVHEFPEDDLKKGLKEIGLVEGRVFNRSLLDRIEQELRAQYFSTGYYGVVIKPTVTPLERNRVDIQIDVIEGRTARIRDVNIVGNVAFDEDRVLDQFELGRAAWWAFLSDRDKYSKQKFAGDLENLRQYYQDRGYLEFSVVSTQVTITPDKRNIYITINLSEGKKYTISEVKLAGKFPVPETELRSLLTVAPGSVFSRKKITESIGSITDRLANDGYAFANVNAIPEVNEEKAQVGFTFFVDAGRKVYVRRVNFVGNMSTRDEVLRREMRQLEGAWFDASKVQRSRARVQRLAYIEDVNVETPVVPGSSDQVDLNVTVKERPSGNLTFGVGYSDAEGVLFNLNVTESNLFGSGNEFSAAFDNSPVSTNLSFRYVNPYYTPDGISRGFQISSSEIDSDQAGTAAYNTKNVSAGMFFAFPLSEDRGLSVGAWAERQKIAERPDIALVAQDFIDRYGPDNTQYRLTLGWSKDTLDNTIMPTQGSLQRFTAESSIPGSDLTFYKLVYTAGRFWRISNNVSFRVKGEFGYGDSFGDTDALPFYKNFYAGGSTTVRGFESRSLGPRDMEITRDAIDPNNIYTVKEGAPIGGDRRVLVNSELFFPVPGDDVNKNMRFSLFLDGGMVYGYRKTQTGQVNNGGVLEPVFSSTRDPLDLGELRYSAGLAFNWFAAVGPISLSYGVPLNKRDGDDTETFQFTLGVPFQ